MAKPFSAADSKVSADRLSDFLRCELTGNLSEVPGIGEKSIEELRNCNTVIEGGPSPIRVVGITSTFGLIAVYLAFRNGVDSDGRPRTVGPVENAQKFYDWLRHIIPKNSQRAGIVDSIGQKLNIIFPGTYEPAVYDDEDGCVVQETSNEEGEPCATNTLRNEDFPESFHPVVNEYESGDMEEGAPAEGGENELNDYTAKQRPVADSADTPWPDAACASPLHPNLDPALVERAPEQACSSHQSLSKQYRFCAILSIASLFVLAIAFIAAVPNTATSTIV